MGGSQSGTGIRDQDRRRRSGFDASYTYDNEGKMTSVGYPAPNYDAGGVFTYSFDGLGRLNGLKDLSNNNVVSNVSYRPANELLPMT